MTPSEVEKLAGDAGAIPSFSIYDGDAPHSFLFSPANVCSFAELIERAAMEKAAKIADKKATDGWDSLGPHDAWEAGGFVAAEQIAAAIRAAAQKEAT